MPKRNVKSFWVKMGLALGGLFTRGMSQELTVANLTESSSIGDRFNVMGKRFMRKEACDAEELVSDGHDDDTREESCAETEYLAEFPVEVTVADDAPEGDAVL